MKDDIIYEPLGEGNYQRIINFLESEISRLKGELLPAAPASSTERDRQRTVPLILRSRRWMLLLNRSQDIVTSEGQLFALHSCVDNADLLRRPRQRA